MQTVAVYDGERRTLRPPVLESVASLVAAVRRAFGFGVQGALALSVRPRPLVALLPLLVFALGAPTVCARRFACVCAGLTPHARAHTRTKTHTHTCSPAMSPVTFSTLGAVA